MQGRHEADQSDRPLLKVHNHCGFFKRIKIGFLFQERYKLKRKRTTKALKPPSSPSARPRLTVSLTTPCSKSRSNPTPSTCHSWSCRMRKRSTFSPSRRTKLCSPTFSITSSHYVTHHSIFFIFFIDPFIDPVIALSSWRSENIIRPFPLLPLEPLHLHRDMVSRLPPLYCTRFEDSSLGTWTRCWRLVLNGLLVFLENHRDWPR